MKKRNYITAILSILWLTAVGLGIGKLLNYEKTPGVAAASPLWWPASSRVKRSLDRATLVMVAHPHCPCTRASIGELARLMAMCQGRLSATVLFFKPKGFPADWEKTLLWRSAEEIPDVSVICDEEGAEAIRFHAETSGQTLLYDKDGKLRFSGGITISRGHSGDNAGAAAIISLLNEGKTSQTESPVFGCQVLDTNSTCAEREKACH